MDLSLLRKNLLDLLTEDLPAGLTAFKEALPEHSEKLTLVLSLQGRLKDVNKERIRNTIDPAEYARRVDTVRAEAFDMVNALEEADFAPPGSAAAEAKASSGKHGSVLYRIPDKMTLQKPSICTIRVAIDEDALLEDIVLDEEVKVRNRVEVSDMMRAEIMDPAGEVFTIRPLGEAEQLVRDTGYTQWLFSVTPRIEGQYQLLVKVSMMEYVEKLGRYVPKDVSIMENISIVTAAQAPADDEPPPLKSSGVSFGMGGQADGATAEAVGSRGAAVAQAAPMATPPPAAAPMATVPPPAAPAAPSSSGTSRPLRAMAVFLAFLALGPAVTWAATPEHVRDLWVAEWKNTPEAYNGYVQKYGHSKDPSVIRRVEEARYRKAELTNQLEDVNDYLENHPNGLHAEQMKASRDALERQEVDILKGNPTTPGIVAYKRQFPEGNHAKEVQDAVMALPEAQRTEILRDLKENGLTLFPGQETANGIATPEDKEWESTLIANRLDHYLDFLKRYPQSLRRTEALKRLLSLRPSLSAEEQDWIDALSADTPEAYMYYLRKHPKGKYGAEARQRIIQFNLTPAEMKRLEAAAAERLRLQQNASSTADSDGDGTTDQKDGCPQDKNKIAPGICGCGTPDADTDGDGIPDCKDDCPKDRGSMAQKGCPGKPADAVTNAPATTNAPANTAPPGDVPAPSSGASSSETTQAVDVPPTPAAPASTGAGRSGMQMVPVTGGSYEMGNDDDDDPGNFAHKVRLGNFQIGRYEVTQADWRNIMGKVPAKAIPRSCDQCPVTGVSWDEVQQFLIQLNEQQPGKNYRLPTEAEWEYAARGGKGAKKTQYPGATELPQVAWYSKNASGRPRVVGEKSPNALGLYDMIGNVSEWCRDLMGYYPTSGVKENPTGPSSGTDRICRGGGWDSDETTCRATERMSYSPATRNAGIGFRLVCDQ